MVDFKKCPNCTRQFAEQADLQRHQEEFHGVKTKDQLYICPNCRRGFTSLTDFNKHRRTHYYQEHSNASYQYYQKKKAEESRPPSPPDFKCKQCGRRMNPAESLLGGVCGACTRKNQEHVRQGYGSKSGYGRSHDREAEEEAREEAEAEARAEERAEREAEERDYASRGYGGRGYYSAEDIFNAYKRAQEERRRRAESGYTPPNFEYGEANPAYSKHPFFNPLASEEEIKKEFRRLAMKYHPDKNPAPEAKDAFIRFKADYDRAIERAQRRARMYG